MTPNVDQALEFLGTAFGACPEGTIWFSAIYPNGEVCSIATREGDAIERFVLKHTRPGAAVYFCPNALRVGATARNKEAVAWLPGLHADIDFKDHPGVPPGRIEDALDQMQKRPSVVVSTGGGFHCYWFYREALEATTPNVGRHEKVLAQLADYLGADRAVAHVAALMRLPGSINFKRETPAMVRALSMQGASSHV